MQKNIGYDKQPAPEQHSRTAARKEKVQTALTQCKGSLEAFGQPEAQTGEWLKPAELPDPEFRSWYFSLEGEKETYLHCHPSLTEEPCPVPSLLTASDLEMRRAAQRPCPRARREDGYLKHFQVTFQDTG